MALDPIKLLCSGDPLEAVVALLKEQLAAAIKAAGGKINAAILAIKTQLKDALAGLIPSLPNKPSFLVELLALKDKIGSSIEEFTAAANALIEKWGKIVANIEAIIENLANLSICDLLTLNFKLNPDGTAELASPPAKTANAAPEKPEAAEITTKSNLPTDFSAKTTGSVDAQAALSKVIFDSELYNLFTGNASLFQTLNDDANYKSFAEKCKNQGLSQDSIDVKNLTNEEQQARVYYMQYSVAREEIMAGLNACTSSSSRINEQLFAKIKSTNGTIPSEEVNSLISSLTGLVTSSTAHTIKNPAIKNDTNALANSLVTTLKSQWKPIAEQAAMQVGIPAVKVIEGQKFADWFNTQGFKNFSATEFTSYFSRALNETPSSSIWTNIVPTLRVVDELCAAIGTKVRITSSYRSPQYNATLSGSAKNSTHIKFQALDIQADGVSPSTIYSILRSWRNQGKFRGGLSEYPNFVHIDTRGYNANW